LRPNTGSTAYNIDPRGLNTNNGGTYWRTVDARFIVRPQEPLLRNHEFSLGAHGDQYGLNTVQTSTAIWPSNYPIAIQQVNLGKTQTTGAYLQDVWKIFPDWKITAGMRAEQWRAMEGSNVSGGVGVNNIAPGIVTLNAARAAGAMFPDSNKSAFSPKGAIEWKATPELTFRGSIARAYRFPTVSELFQSLSTPNSVTVNNPNLQPEICTCYDFTTDYRWVDAFDGAIGLFNPRVSLFLDERWNAIVNQRTIDPLGRQVNANSNIDRARFRGVELAMLAKDALIPGLDIEGGVTFTDSKILNNFSSGDFRGAAQIGNIGSGTPAVFFAGRQFPRVPRIRIRGVASYSPNPDMSFAVGLRYSSASFVTLANTDFNHNDFNNSDSDLLFIDLKARYRVAPNWWLSAGVNNVGRYKAYVNPNPYPQRMFFLALNYDIGGPDDAPASGLGGAAAAARGGGGALGGPAMTR
jgi:iron complex outermembrane receptor protein